MPLCYSVSELRKSLSCASSFRFSHPLAGIAMTCVMILTGVQNNNDSLRLVHCRFFSSYTHTLAIWKLLQMSLSLSLPLSCPETSRRRSSVTHEPFRAEVCACLCHCSDSTGHNEPFLFIIQCVREAIYLCAAAERETVGVSDGTNN